MLVGQPVIGGLSTSLSCLLGFGLSRLEALGPDRAQLIAQPRRLLQSGIASALSA